VLATPLRRSLLRPWLYLGALIAFAFLAPSLYWQAAHGWPFLAIGEAGASHKNIALSPLAFVGQQVLYVGPVLTPIWLAGLWRFAARPTLPHLRAFPIAYAVMAVLFYVLHGKAYYLTPVYPVLLAGGAVAIEAWLVRPRFRLVVLRVVAISGIVAAPLVLPILPPADDAGYARLFGMSPETTATEYGAQSELPQQFADMFGWREMAAKISAVYNALPPDERAKAVFIGRNYGEAAALDVYGPALHGPPAISGHNNFFLWGPDGFDGSVVIVVGGNPARYAEHYRSVEQVGELDNRFAMSYETNIPIFVLRGPRAPLTAVWPMLRHYE
jgi:hypothetical protein